jgi:hypothetical protein
MLVLIGDAGGWGVCMYMGHSGWMENRRANPTVMLRACTNRDRISRTW